MKPVELRAPRVSVGIPLYRSSRFLDTIVANIDAMPKEGVEILISDRHGEDDAIDRLRARYGRDPRIRFFHRRDQLNWVGNINFLLDEARGEFWRFLPHDDLSPAGSLEALIAALDAQSEAVLAYGRIEAVDLCGTPIERTGAQWHPQPARAEAEWSLDIALEMAWNFFWFDGAFQGLVRRSVLVENNLRIRETLGSVYSERCWQFALCLLGRFVFVPEARYIKRYYSESTHRQWTVTGSHLYSVAFVHSVFLWELVRPFGARLYGIADLFWKARAMARWMDNPDRGSPPLLRRIANPLSPLLKAPFVGTTPGARKWIEALEGEIEEWCSTPLPSRKRPRNGANQPYAS